MKRLWRRWFTGVGALEFEAGIRASISLLVPLLILLGLGRLDLSVYASFGAFTSLYGRSEPYRLRFQTLTVAALSLLAIISVATLLSAYDAPIWVLGVALALVVAFGIAMSEIMGWIPRGSIFFVFALLVIANVPIEPQDVPQALLVAASSAAFSVLIGMSGWVLRKIAPRPARAVFRPLHRRPKRALAPVKERTYWYLALVNVIGVVGAWLLALASGIGHPYWAAVAVAAIMPTLASLTGYRRMFHRFFGTAAGVLVAAALFLWEPSPLTLIIFIVLAQLGAELFVARHYGTALLFITPLALGASNLGPRDPWGPLLVDRVIETGIGAAVAIVIVFVSRRVVNREKPAATA
ncbi:FUSC family protein [Salinibacterium sp. ZJ450]|uniref:FUSC family protein n=1 Tax=Salinibacterium sp. ZJ450 TaxID=2708338 RepID=UPI00141E3032|nr:FUSC family protein [Salinibacterium sp. ZJ450]